MASNAAAARSTVASARRRPTICKPTGTPSAVTPHGTEIAGCPVRAGTKIAALLGAAAHDPQVFERPAELDVGRRRNPHLGFGAGVHYCLGAPLARLEVAATLDALRRRLPGLVLHAEPVRRPDFVMRGLP